MLLKTILLFLLAMVLVGMVGKALFPGAVARVARVRRCADCGRPRIGQGACGCREKA
jgi:hypothetical protein